MNKRGVKECCVCGRLIRSKNKSNLCQGCYIRVYQMMKSNKHNHNFEECVNYYKEKYKGICKEYDNVISNVYKGGCIE